jgi:hypothetical protein
LLRFSHGKDFLSVVSFYADRSTAIIKPTTLGLRFLLLLRACRALLFLNTVIGELSGRIESRKRITRFCGAARA